MEISKTLEADIEDFFTRRFLAEEKLEKKRADDKKRRSRERMRRKRKWDKRLKELSLFRSDDILSEKEYQSAKKKVEDKYEKEKKEILLKEGNVTQSPLKGKDTTNLNVFLVGCYYWIKKEKPGEPDSEILKYICDFLEKKDYKMKNGKNYDIDAIKTRIRDHHKKKDPDDKRRIEKLLDRY